MNRKTKRTVIGSLLLLLGIAIMWFKGTAIFSLLGSAFIGAGIGLLSIWLRKPETKEE